MAWNGISDQWKLAFTQAISAYVERGSAPIGAVIVDASGALIAEGANESKSGHLAHAETNALAAIPPETDRSTCELYTTLEPCPMCIGASRICKIRSVHFAAFDPSAGSTKLLDASAFMRAVPCEVHPPADAEQEAVAVALVMEYRLRTGHRRWLQRWQEYQPLATSLGELLVERSTHAAWVGGAATPESIYEQVASMLEASAATG